MSYTIAFERDDYDKLRAHLGRDRREQAAFAFARWGQWPGGARLIVREIVEVAEEGFEEQRHNRLVIAPATLNHMIKHAAQTDQALILIHSHPGATDGVWFSPVDDRGEEDVFAAVYRRAPDRPHASLVFGENCVAGRVWLPDGTWHGADKLTVLGSRLDVALLDGQLPREVADELHDRQVRAFGVAGQSRMARLTAAVVGLGGTGSVTAEQLLRLGVGRLLVIDDDRLEPSNVSRVYGSRVTDAEASLSKVAVAVRELGAIGTNTVIEGVEGSVVDNSVALRLREADVIFGCTDTHWSRAVMQAVAYQYATPLIDMGNKIDATDGTIRAMSGRVSLVWPGLPCLNCTGIVNPKQVADESLPEVERAQLQREGYVTGLDAPNPSVISLNTVVSGLAVTAFLNLVTGFEGETIRHQLTVDVLRGTLRDVQYSARPHCLCQQSNFVRVGDVQHLPTRFTSAVNLSAT